MHCDKFQGLTSGEQLQMSLPLEESSVYCAFTAVADWFVNVVGRMGPVELMSDNVIHATLAMVSTSFG